MTTETLTGPTAIAYARAHGLTTVDVVTREIGCAPQHKPTKLDAIPDGASITLDLADLRDKCRATLGRLRHSQPFASVPARAREYLENLGLVTEHTAGLIEATARGRGYVADPSTFDV